MEGALDWGDEGGLRFSHRSVSITTLCIEGKTGEGKDPTGLGKRKGCLRHPFTDNSTCEPNSHKEDFIDMEAPMLDDVQLVVMVGSLKYSSFQTLSARTPNRAA